jgi:hypothetical protein
MDDARRARAPVERVGTRARRPSARAKRTLLSRFGAAPRPCPGRAGRQRAASRPAAAFGCTLLRIPSAYFGAHSTCGTAGPGQCGVCVLHVRASWCYTCAAAWLSRRCGICPVRPRPRRRGMTPPADASPPARSPKAFREVRARPARRPVRPTLFYLAGRARVRRPLPPPPPPARARDLGRRRERPATYAYLRRPALNSPVLGSRAISEQ